MRIDVVFIDIDGAKVNEVIDVFVKQAQGRIRKKTNSAVIALPADPNNANSPHIRHLRDNHYPVRRLCGRNGGTTLRLKLHAMV